MSEWNWYGVKILYKFSITGKPDLSDTNQVYDDKYESYEESIVLVKAQSFDHAYDIAKCIAEKSECKYQNPFGELVHYKLVDSIDCFMIGETDLNTGSELYSRIIHIPKNENTQDTVNRLYPETEGDSLDKQKYRLRYMEFNK